MDRVLEKAAAHSPPPKHHLHPTHHHPTTPGTLPACPVLQRVGAKRGMMDMMGGGGPAKRQMMGCMGGYMGGGKGGMAGGMANYGMVSTCFGGPWVRGAA